MQSFIISWYLKTIRIEMNILVILISLCSATTILGDDSFENNNTKHSIESNGKNNETENFNSTIYDQVLNKPYKFMYLEWALWDLKNDIRTKFWLLGSENSFVKGIFAKRVPNQKSENTPIVASQRNDIIDFLHEGKTFIWFIF